MGGTVFGGQQPVVGASVAVYAAGSGGYGSMPTLLGSDTTNQNGAWSVNVSCPPGNPQTYVVANGGNAGFSGANGALALVAALGPCATAAVLTNVNINEVTTVASIYALSRFFDATAANIGSTSSNVAGLDHAVANIAQLVDVTTGLAPDAAQPGVTAPTPALYTLANLIGACVNSSGGAAGDNNACGLLFTAATPPGGAAPANTAQAVLDIARNPGNNVGQLFDLIPPNPVFAPTLSAVPSGWTLALSLSGGGVNTPTSIAIDAGGNAWVANFNGSVSTFSPVGLALTGTGGITGGGLKECIGIAVDGAGNVWVTDEESPSNVNSALGSITKLGQTGNILSGTSGYTGGGINFPESIAIDPQGNAWIGNFGKASVTKLKSDGTAVSPSGSGGGYRGGGLAFPVSVTIDASGNVWVSNQGNNSVTELNSSGTVQSPSGGYTPAGLSESGGICADAGGDIWVSSYFGDSVVELAGASANTPGAALSPSAGYTGGGLKRPYGCAIDGAGTVWVANHFGNSLTALAGASASVPGAPLSAAAGYENGSLDAPYGVAVDASGNVWVSSYGNNSLSVLLGAAAPVKTPILGPPVLP